MFMVKHAYIDLMFSEYFQTQDKQGATGHEVINMLHFETFYYFKIYLNLLITLNYFLYMIILSKNAFFFL